MSVILFHKEWSDFFFPLRFRSLLDETFGKRCVARIPREITFIPELPRHYAFGVSLALPIHYQ